MAEISPEQRIQDSIDQALTTAYNSLTAVRESMVGAGQQAHDAYRGMHEQATRLPGLGASMRDYIDKLKADESQPADYRAKKAADVYKATAEAIRQEYDSLMKQSLPALESALGEASLPQPSKDAGDRVLRRQELDRLLSGVSGAALAGRMADMLGKNPAWDAEVLSDHGRA